MKQLLLLALCLFPLNIIAQQKLNTFHLVDDSTKKPIPSVSVSILRAKLSITTEKDGIFSIPGDLSKMGDTVIFSASYYEPRQLLLENLSIMDSIGLKRITEVGNTIKLKFKKDTLLNDFDKNEVSYYTGLHTGYHAFQFLQLAQRFDTPRPGTVLNHVYIQRLAFFLNYYSTDIEQRERLELEYTKFRLRFYDLDVVTGGPGKDICNQVIEINSSDQKQPGIDLSKYNIIIPGKTFFLAVEWLRDYYNYGKVKMHDIKEIESKEYDYYQPSIGISPNTGKKLNIWALDFAHHWIPYTDYAPLGTDLAIKAKVAY